MSKKVTFIIPDNACIIVNYAYYNNGKMELGQTLLEDEDLTEGKEFNVETMEDTNELKERIDKTIKYINKQSKTNPSLNSLLVGYEIEELLQILKGEEYESNRFDE